MGRSRHHATFRGFTLVEAVVVVGIVGILGSMAFAGFQGLRDRTAARNGVRDVVGLMKSSRTQAFVLGAPVVFFVRTLSDGTREYGAFVDADLDFDPGDLDAGVGDTNDRTLERRTLPAGVALIESGAPNLSTPLPEPFRTFAAGVPCGFCSTDGDVVVVFASNGTARLGPTPANHPIGGTFTLAGKSTEGSASRYLDVQTIAVLSSTGTVSVFNR